MVGCTTTECCSCGIYHTYLENLAVLYKKDRCDLDCGLDPMQVGWHAVKP